MVGEKDRVRRKPDKHTVEKFRRNFHSGQHKVLTFDEVCAHVRTFSSVGRATDEAVRKTGSKKESVTSLGVLRTFSSVGRATDS